jgi:polyhydroxyalkanoate synthesis regulator phasin
MADQVTRKELKALQTQVDDLSKQLGSFINKTFEERMSGAYRAILEGDKVAEQKVAPLRDQISAIEKRLTVLED